MTRKKNISLLTVTREQVILSALQENRWNRTRAAKALGVHVRTVRRMVEELRERGIEVPDSHTNWRWEK